jgi:hypothetical protein
VYNVSQWRRVDEREERRGDRGEGGVERIENSAQR